MACFCRAAVFPRPEPVPDFLFPDADGHLVSISALLEKGPLVISLNRGHWCPYCRLALRGLAQAVFTRASRRALEDPEKVRRLRGAVARAREEIEAILSGQPHRAPSDL